MPISAPVPVVSATETLELLSVVIRLFPASYAFTSTSNVSSEVSEVVDSVAVILAIAPGVIVMDEVASVNPPIVAVIVFAPTVEMLRPEKV